ncbi:hypothetical protein [Natrinema salsiterrestre]|uniref:Uncharacterized protein n=1 Tax=Natrinema salsiterrestre TaxID=2950540 RepID=A0A9Q4L3Y7_9EURY|nr:hypothetical protein [Natrinema salsiterrestre]MDF9747876.1 hypothetical protein [Natrinema salsiterrestre]
MDKDKPTVDAYDAETGAHVAEGTVVEPDLSRWQRGYRRLKTGLLRRPEIWLMLTAGVLLVAELS